MTDRSHKTKFIAFEGIDGSGKTVQTDKLKDALEVLGYRVIIRSFPVYESFFGQEIGTLLAGTKSVTANSLDPKSMCLWYALDRWKAFQGLAWEAYDFVLLNRFTLSNAVYQSMRTIPEEREALIDWVFELEHVQLGLPVPDVYVLFDAPPEISIRNNIRKGHRDYVGSKPDVYEASNEMMRDVRGKYLQIAEKLGDAFVVNCVRENGEMRSLEDIFYEVKKGLDTRGFFNS